MSINNCIITLGCLSANEIFYLKLGRIQCLYVVKKFYKILEKLENKWDKNSCKHAKLAQLYCKLHNTATSDECENTKIFQQFQKRITMKIFEIQSPNKKQK